MHPMASGGDSALPPAPNPKHAKLGNPMLQTSPDLHKNKAWELPAETPIMKCFASTGRNSHRLLSRLSMSCILNGSGNGNGNGLGQHSHSPPTTESKLLHLHPHP